MRKIVLILTVISSLLLGALIAPAGAQTLECQDIAPPTHLGDIDVGRVAQSYSSVRADVGSNVILATMFSGDTFSITGQPVCSGAHWWYPVTFNMLDGWATEGQRINGVDHYWLEATPKDGEDPGSGGGDDDDDFGTGGPVLVEPYVPQLGNPVDDSDTNFTDPFSGVAYSRTQCTGAPASRLSPEMDAEVAQIYSNLRMGVHSNVIIATLRTGDTLTVIDGPFCATGMGTPYHWYLVEHDGQPGWVTEGTGNSYWLAPVN